MPELPEVRTVVKTLKNNILNKEIKEIKIIYPKMITEDSLDLNLLKGKKIKDIETKGKFILFKIDKYTLISHLRMEGKYYLKNIKDAPVKHEHIIFIFTDNTTLTYHDTRKFGRMTLLDDITKSKSLINLGKEPFDISSETLYEKINKRKTPIKTILLNQEIMSGLGNIYVDEVLFEAKINPHKKGNNITKEETTKIIDSSIKILNQAIKEKGTTIRSYTSSLGVYGNYQNYLKVYGKEICPVCKNKLTKDKIGGRSTTYCSYCTK